MALTDPNEGLVVGGERRRRRGATLFSAYKVFS